jgi:hypothetical protein
MANQTPNYDLTKPLASEFYDVGVQNGNMDKIDTQMKANADAITILQTGQAGKADLVDGKVPASELPSYVDDVLEYANLAAFPATGETCKIYVALDTNKTYRWSGTTYVEISESLALGETSSTAYAGDKGKVAYDHSFKTNNPHGVTPAQIGAPTISEFSDLQAYVGYTSDDIYGVEVDLVNQQFTRLAGAYGKTPGTAFNGVKAFGGRKRCCLSDAGVVIAYYGDAGFTETGKLTQAVTINGTTYPIGTVVQVMVEQPRFYYKVVPLVLEKITDGKGYHMRKGRYYISDTPKEGFKVHPAFVSNGIEKEKIYLSAYEGSLFDVSSGAYILDDAQVADFSNDKLCSIAGAKPISGLTQNLTRANLRALAQKRGTGWQSQYCATVSATQMLFLIEYASFNTQTCIGHGAVLKVDDGASNLSEASGTTSGLGNASGAAVNGNGVRMVSYRGEENIWGNIWKSVDGMNINAKGIHDLYVADNSFADSVITGAYQNAGFTLAKTAGYISAFGYSEDFDWLFVTSETNGNTALPVGDYFWQNYTRNDVMIALLGAHWGASSYAGGFCWIVANAPGDRTRAIGGRAVYIPS